MVLTLVGALVTALPVGASAAGGRVGHHDGGRADARWLPPSHGMSRRLPPAVRGRADDVTASRRGGDIVR